MRSLIRFCVLCLSVLALTQAVLAADPKINVLPAQIELSDAYARRQLLVSFAGRDATREATYESLNADIVSVDARGYVTPKADGAAH